jgi:ech hydrogenase subunit D
MRKKFVLKELLPVGTDNLLGETAGIKVAGYRFVTMSCTVLDADHFDILYHFDRGLELKHLRLTATGDMAIPSISPIYFAAFLVENEIQDLFGIRFTGLAIDYDRTLYGEEKTRVTPFCKYTVVTPHGPRDPSGPESAGMRTQEDA